MEPEIVGWLADREEATRAYGKTLACRRRRTSAFVIAGAMLTATSLAVLVFELVERAVL
jgi:hypothetical protein